MKTLTKNIETNNTIQDPKEYKLFPWAGSKQKYSKEFKNVLNKMNNDKPINVKYYVEGLSGSLMSMFHNLQMVNPEIIVINDLNEKLINLYIQIQKNPELVWEGYKKIEDKFESLIPTDFPRVRVYPKDRRNEVKGIDKLYKYIRGYINSGELDWVHSSCMLFVLNHNFNGLYGENKSGEFNISFNWNTKSVNIQKIKESIFNLNELFNSKEIIFESLDIKDLVLKYNHPDTFIYLDPPYINTKIQYKKREKGNSFNEVETHIELLDSVSKYKYVMYSNNHHEDFVSMGDSYVNFDRTNKINGNSKKSLKEILLYKVNESEVSTDNKEHPLKISATEIKTVSNNQNYIPVDSEYNLKLGTCFSGLDCPGYVLKENKIPHTTEFVCDNNKFCRETLVKNYNPKRVFGDITKLDGYSLPSPDLYVWGSPCQDLSQSNNEREGLKGKKSILFFEGLRILKETQPKYSIFENVPGLLSSNSGEDFKEVMRLFEELGNYTIYWKKINPVDIGGNTTRVRVFVILIRKDIGIKFNFPKNTGTTKCIKDCLIKGDYKYYDKSEYIPWERPLHKQRGVLKKDFKLLSVSRHEQQRVFNINYPSPTIQRSGVVHINDGIGVRQLSPDELQKIQGLDNLDMSHLSKTQKLSQLGNTMEVTTMSKLIGEIVRIDKIHYNSQKTQEKKVS